VVERGPERARSFGPGPAGSRAGAEAAATCREWSR
jgi:hypothetical protein